MENWPNQVPPDSSYPPTQPGYMAPPHSSSTHISEQTPSAYAPPSIYPYESVSHIQPPRRLKNPLWVALIAAVIVLGVAGTVVAVVANKSGSSQTTPQPTSAPVQVGQATNTPSQANQATPQPTSVPDQPSPSAGTHTVGEVVSIDGWSMVVNGVKTSQGGQFDTPEHPGDTFLEIDVSVTNRTGQSQDFSSGLDFTLKDASGQTYNQTFVSGTPAPPDGRVTDGSKLRGTVVYEVPGSMHTFEFDATPNPFASNPDIAVWSLSI